MTEKKKDELQEEIDEKADETAEEIEEKEDSGKEETEINEESKEEPEEPAEDENVKYLRLMADFQNYKKRVEKEKKDLYAYANENIMNDLLTVLDNFERALDHDDGEGFKEGVEMIFKQLGDALEKSGLTEIPALGEEFDPQKHNAVMTEDTDEYESGKVSGVMQKGYTLNGKVIRPSMVKVAN
ncbi:MAG: nucleotide exchange factor GrpE [Clostridia bacterium]|nr:nucleotide exchange factor GrpE [Clostridia bacterium]